jgi:hypothetical protein
MKRIDDMTDDRTGSYTHITQIEGPGKHTNRWFNISSGSGEGNGSTGVVVRFAAYAVPILPAIAD